MSRLVSMSVSHPLLLPHQHHCINVLRHRTTKPIPEIGKTTYVYKNLPEPGGEFEENEFLPRRLSYWPPELGQHRPRNRVRPWDKVKSHLTLYPPEEDTRPEYTENPEYPAITDYSVSSILSKEKSARLEWYEKIRQLPTFIEKMSELTSADRQHCIKVRAWAPFYNNLYHYQYMTRTNLIPNLPDLYEKIDVSDIKSVASDAILDAIRLSYGESSCRERGRLRRSHFELMPKHLFPEVSRCEGLIIDLANVAMKACIKRSPHLMQCQTDLSPEVQSFWYLRLMDLPNKGLKFSNPGTHYPNSNTGVQFQDLAMINIRSQQPLDPIVPQDSEEIATQSFSATKRNPAQDGYALKRCRVTSHAGFWPGTDDFEFPFLSIYPLHVLKFREYLVGRRLEDEDSAINAMAMMYSFAWCNSLAFYHGFSPYDELTYPFTTQTICTDGQTWNFSVYQLNTHAFHGDLSEPSKSNICWTSGPMKLFEGIEDGKLVGVNHSVVDLFLKFLVREPSLVQAQNLRPYLGQDTRSPEKQAEDEFKLRRWFGQAMGQSERYYIQRAATLPFEWIIAERNPHAPPAINFRRAPKYQHLLRLDRKKFTI